MNKTTTQKLVVTKEFLDKLYAAYVHYLTLIFLKQNKLNWTLQNANDFIVNKSQVETTSSEVARLIGVDTSVVTAELDNLWARARSIR